MLSRQVEPEQALLRVQFQGSREIGLLVAGGAGGAAMARGVRAREIGGDAEHAPGAESLDPHLLERAEDRLRHLPVRRQTMMQLDVVVTQAKRRAIRLAAQPRHVLGRHRAPRRRQLQTRRLAGPPVGALRLRLPARAAAFGGAETDVERGLVGDRAAGGGERALKAFQAFLAERAHPRAQPLSRLVLTGLSGSSTPRQRW